MSAIDICAWKASVAVSTNSVHSWSAFPVSARGAFGSSAPVAVAAYIFLRWQTTCAFAPAQGSRVCWWKTAVAFAAGSDGGFQATIPGSACFFADRLPAFTVAAGGEFCPPVAIATRGFRRDLASITAAAIGVSCRRSSLSFPARAANLWTFPATPFTAANSSCLCRRESSFAFATAYPPGVSRGLSAVAVSPCSRFQFAPVALATIGHEYAALAPSGI